MAAITARQLREKTTQELADQLMLEKKRLFDGVVKNASGEAIKAHEKREGRRLIARIQGILRERKLRKELDQRISTLTVKAKDAHPRTANVVKAVEQRAAEIKSALEKAPAAGAGRHVKPMLKRTKAYQVELPRNYIPKPADRAALQLAEAKRLRASLERADVGQ